MKNKLLTILKMASSFGLMWGIGHLAHQQFDWWITAVVAAAVCFVIPINGVKSFAMGTTAFGLLWGLEASGLNGMNNELLSTKMGELFGGLTPMQLIYATVLIGGVLGGFGAMTGSLFRQVFFPMDKSTERIEIDRSTSVTAP